MSFTESEQQIIDRFENDISVERWRDWKWQLKHCVKDVDTFEKLLGYTFPEEKRKDIAATISKFPLSITPYYLSLIDTTCIEDDPIFKQSFPDVRELDIAEHDMEDPLHEDGDSPVDGITHRYPDRVLFLISNTCAMYCRHCTRKRKVGDVDSIPNREQIEKGLE
jgi:lysine 2,3-aminomutase